MKKVYCIQETPKLLEIIAETLPAFIAAVHERNPEAEELADDEELAQVLDLLILLRLGHLKVTWGDNDQGRMLMLEVKEDPFALVEPQAIF